MKTDDTSLGSPLARLPRRHPGASLRPAGGPGGPAGAPPGCVPVRRPRLTVVRGGAAEHTPAPLPPPPPADLCDVARHPMPAYARGALVTRVAPAGGGVFEVRWVAAHAPARIPSGRVELRWTAAEDGRTEVTARLGLPGAQVLLARWPSLHGDWSDVVRPTVAEVMGLHSALRLATEALKRLTD